MTIDQLNKLSDEEVRVRMARVLGWKNVRSTTIWKNRVMTTGVFGSPPCHDADVYEHEAVPRFTDDLNAMHEAEKTLTEDQCDAYNTLLMDLKPSRSERQHPSERWSWGSIAKHRALAFLAVTEREEG